METTAMGWVLTEALIDNLNDLWDTRRGLMPPDQVRKVTVPGDGFRTLVNLTRLRPIETGEEGVSSGPGVIVKVEALQGTNVGHIRAACKLLA